MLAPLPLSEWEGSRLYWQLVCQIVGKIRLKLHPPINHWWHVTLYVSARGLTTGGIPYQGGTLDIELDLIDHQTIIRTSSGRQEQVALAPRPIADYYQELMDALSSLGIEVKIVGRPYDAKSTIPFAEDHEHATYDADAIRRAWLALSHIDLAFKDFRGRFIGKCSPVHLFWHSFDLACTRFSGRGGPSMEGADGVSQEAYSHEVISAGFWFGDNNVPKPAFYCYSYPLPDGLVEEKLAPSAAYWQELRGSTMAMLDYDDVRQSDDPSGMILEFLQSSYETGARLSKWDRSALERVHT
jgi:hypothetical protein